MKMVKMMKMIPFNIDVRAVSHSCDVLHGSSLLRSPWLEPIVYWAVILVFDLYSRAREVCGVCYNCAMCCWECLVCGIKLCAFCSDEPHCTAVQCTAVFDWPVCTALIVHCRMLLRKWVGVCSVTVFFLREAIFKKNKGILWNSFTNEWGEGGGKSNFILLIQKC